MGALYKLDIDGIPLSYNSVDLLHVSHSRCEEFLTAADVMMDTKCLIRMLKSGNHELIH